MKMIDSEIQFLLNLVLNHKISTEVKKICLERIGQIEQNLRTTPRPSQFTPTTIAQAPSTQAILDSMAPPPAANVMIPSSARDKETGLVNVVTSNSPGGSTRGPSKVFR
jgi:hypothetical protein